MTLPNQLTILRIILSPVFLYLFLSNQLILNQISIVVFVVAALSDWYDGWLARKFNYITSWGKFWDPLADKILTSTAFIAFAILDLVPYWMVILIILRDFIVTLIRAFADKKGLIFLTSRYAKWKTMLQMIFLYYLLIIYVASKTPALENLYPELISILLNEKLIYYVMLLITIITIHSGYLYLKKNWSFINKLLNSETVHNK